MGGGGGLACQRDEACLNPTFILKPSAGGPGQESRIGMRSHYLLNGFEVVTSFACYALNSISLAKFHLEYPLEEFPLHVSAKSSAERRTFLPSLL